MNNNPQLNQQQAAIRMTMLNNQPNTQTTGPTTMAQNQQAVPQPNVTGPSQQSIVSAATAATVQAPVTSQAGTQSNPQLASRERQTIWHGVLEWIEKAKVPTDQQKQTRHVPCSVSANLKDGEPELSVLCQLYSYTNLYCKMYVIFIEKPIPGHRN